MESVKVKKTRKQDSKRLTLTEKSQGKATIWLSQIEEEFNGMLTLKRNDLLNAILENLDDKLPSQLLSKIRNEELTTKKVAEWIYKKTLEAEKTGQQINLDELLKTAQGGSSKGRKKARKTQNKTSQTPLSESAKISPRTADKPSNSI